jgi:hypothetical protein
VRRGSLIQPCHPAIANVAAIFHPSAVEEERLSPVWTIGCAVISACFVAIAAWFVFTMVNVTHDYSVNSQLQILWENPKGAPLGLVVTANNRWMENAFVADESREDGKKVAVLILDDHYRSDDLTLRSQSGVIGDPISRKVLCSIPAQAEHKHVAVDRKVQLLIDEQCGTAR